MLRDLHRRLRPMGFADILDEAVDLYRKNFVLLAGTGAFLYVPLVLLQIAARDPGFDPAKATAAAVGLYVARVVAAVVFYWFAAMFVTGALTFATSDIYLGRKTTILECYRGVSRPSVFFSFIWASILMGWVVFAAFLVPVVFLGGGIAVLVTTALGPVMSVVFGVILLLVGIGALIVPAYVASRLAVYTPAFFIERRGAWSSIRRSWTLLKGRVLNTFGLLLIVSIIIIVLKQIVLSPFFLPMLKGLISGAEARPAMTTAYGAISSALDAIMVPVNSMVVILIYYNARIRDEGFDLEILAAEMNQQLGESRTSSLPEERLPQSRNAPPDEEQA